MLKQRFFCAIFAALLTSAALADTVQLKDKATVVGTILAEKHDQVVVDIGYTVLTIPRKEIVKVSKGTGTGAEKSAKNPVQPPEPEPAIAKPAAPTPNPP